MQRSHRDIAFIHGGKVGIRTRIALIAGRADPVKRVATRILLRDHLIRRVPVKGDRRDHFEAETDLWEISMRIAAVRKEREIDPAVDALKACVAGADSDSKLHPVAAKRLRDMLAFIESVDRWYAPMMTVPRSKLAALIRLGTRIVSLLPMGRQK